MLCCYTQKPELINIFLVLLAKLTKPLYITHFVCFWVFVSVQCVAETVPGMLGYVLLRIVCQLLFLIYVTSSCKVLLFYVRVRPHYARVVVTEVNYVSQTLSCVSTIHIAVNYFRILKQPFFTGMHFQFSMAEMAAEISFTYETALHLKSVYSTFSMCFCKPKVLYCLKPVSAHILKSGYVLGCFQNFWYPNFDLNAVNVSYSK
jgi:hypothetical protein